MSENDRFLNRIRRHITRYRRRGGVDTFGPDLSWFDVELDTGEIYDIVISEAEMHSIIDGNPVPFVGIAPDEL